MKSQNGRPAIYGNVLPLMAVGAIALFGAGNSLRAQDPGSVPSNVGTTIGLPYQGPPPSELNRNLVGPVKLLRSATVDMTSMTATLPLYEGHMRDGRTVWYLLTDTDDQGNADALGLNYSSKLSYADVGRAVRHATLGKNAELTFDVGTVDFRPDHRLVPGTGPNAFPPKVSTPGSVGDADYTPLIKIINAGGHIYNAPVIAFDVSAAQINFPNGGVDHRLVHDRVTRIDPSKMTATVKLTPGFSFGRSVLYLSFEASDPVAATLEEATLTPAFGDIKVGADDGAFSAIERLFSFANGPMGSDNPQRQGLSSAIADAGVAGPLNVFGGVPTIAGDYSPLWDMNLGEWTADAIQRGYRSRLIDEFQILDLAQKGFITAPMGKKYGSSGIIITCPIVMRLR